MSERKPWTIEENQKFENIVFTIPLDDPNRYEKMAAQMNNGRTVEELKEWTELLERDLVTIMNGTYVHHGIYVYHASAAAGTSSTTAAVVVAAKEEDKSPST
ncbi:protein RADIALIS-like 3 [Trifolium pratense]|uniref:Uncharacterized protein n=1 Tax=Trifolium pratense TaxID=57577 RepID=A0ACB0KK72_TRIPR|nr:protein RADIALIS-like 3 [Trifolium pratense]CAJ2656946.1 unnamed protein product [Trifolium pratense]